MSDKDVYLFEGKRWSSKSLLNLTTDANGVAHFSLNTTGRPEEEINLMVCWPQSSSCGVDIIVHRLSHNKNTPPLVAVQASVLPNIDYYPYRTPYVDIVERTIPPLRPATPYTATTSSLSIQKIAEPLQCEAEIPVTIEYTIVGETVDGGSVDVFYLVSV